MEKVIVTGGSGFVGRYFVSRLITEKYSVVMLSRKDVDGIDKNVCLINVDLSDDVSVNNCLSHIPKADVFVHLAADISVPGDTNTIGNNIKGMQSAMRIASHAGVKRFIYISSIPVIGDIKYTPIDEKHPVNPQTSYHWSKYLCEIMLEHNNEAIGSTVVLRLPSPVGVGMNDNTFLSILIDRFIKDKDVEIYGNGDRVQNYIDVRDVSDAIIKAIRSKNTGKFLVAGMKSVSNYDLALIVKKITNSSSKVITGLHEDCEESNKWIIDTTQAYEMLGFKPQYSIEDSILWIVGENYE